MLVKFYEVKTNTEQGVYKISDFYKSTWALFTMSDSPKGALVAEGVFNFDASDVMAELTILLSDYAYPHRLTHVIAVTNPTETDITKSKRMAYTVQSVEYMGQKQVKLHLIEDAFLAHIQETVSTPLLLQRTNDPSYFLGNDIKDLGFSRLRSVKEITNLTDYTGKWVVYTYLFDSKNVDGLNKKSEINALYRNLQTSDYEYFSTLADVVSKYPTAAYVSNPTSISYFNKIVNVAGQLYQCQWNFASNGVLNWAAISTTYTNLPINPGTTIPMWNDPETGTFGEDINVTKLVSGDVNTINIAFPFADNLYAQSVISVDPSGVLNYGYVKVPCADRFLDLFARIGSSTISLKNYLISVRVVTGLAFGENGSFRKPTPVNDHIYLSSPQMKVIGEWLPVDSTIKAWLPVIYNMQMSKTFNFGITPTAITSEPFSKYYLSVYGHEIPIKDLLSNKDITLSISVSSTGCNILVYTDNINNVIFSGTVNMTLPTSLDKFSEFLAQNSNYTAIRTANWVLGGGSRLLSGAISGFMAGNPLLGVTVSATSIGQQIANDLLQVEAMKNAPDALKSNNSDYTSLAISAFGIFAYAMNVPINVYNQMTPELNAKGFPVSKLLNTLGDVSYQSNLIYGSTKFVVGILTEMVYNFHVTSEINKRLAGGLFLCP